MYKLILEDGTTIENLTMNGSNYVSETEIDESIFEDNLSTMTVVDEDAGTEETLENVEFIQQVHYENFHGNTGYYFCFRQLSERELKDLEVQAQIDYIAMMADIDLEA